MAPLSPRSLTAIARLRSYTSPPGLYYTLSLSRRAAVLILLFADKTGELRVVLTVRSKQLRNYAGQVALPGGKADASDGSPWETARREAYEEIGLPETNRNIPAPFQVEHLCQLPTNLAMTELAVRPCVAFLSTGEDPQGGPVDAEESLIPRLQTSEVSEVFTAPLFRFLVDEPNVDDRGKRSKWYEGQWNEWNGTRWKMHCFYAPRTAAGAGPKFNRVFGLTARILVDTARIAYAEQPSFEYNFHFGDEDMMQRLVAMGRLREKEDGKETADRLSPADLLKARNIKM